VGSKHQKLPSHKKKKKKKNICLSLITECKYLNNHHHQFDLHHNTLVLNIRTLLKLYFIHCHMYMFCPEPLQIHQCISDSGTVLDITWRQYVSLEDILHTLSAPATVCLHSDVADNAPCATPLNDSVTTPLSELHYLMLLNYKFFLYCCILSCIFLFSCKKHKPTMHCY